MDIFYFYDGQVASNYIGEFVAPTKSSYVHYCAAPIIYDNWTVEKPVTLWAACYTDQEPCSSAYFFGYNDCVKKWRHSVKIGIKVEGAMSNDASLAVTNARSRYLLLSQGYAPIVYWNNPEAILSTFKLNFLVAIILPNCIIGIVLLVTLYFSRSKRKLYEKI
eukprot:TRINITY_DN7655_c0_g1_i1.p1 TRINITY_DN7655_c0_g1~~TRINITY_DN7655_c0_g1_i1.p1  ORF type:complete len:163 (-),score=6.51 TRINITY_DN7655_c0_g1_i1:31-519(-)